MKLTIIKYILIVLPLLGGSALSWSSESLSFVSCPIARDIGEDVDLCFYTVYEGQRYSVSIPPDWSRPQLNHQVLVEGFVSNEQRACGASLIVGRISVLPEIAPQCNQIDVDDGKVEGRAYNLFTVGPQALKDKANKMKRDMVNDPTISLKAVMIEPPHRTIPEAPFENQHLTIYFPFESDRASGPDMMKLVNMVDYAKTSKGQFVIEAYQGISLLSNGESVAEKNGMAMQRANKLKRILAGLGVALEQIAIRKSAKPVQGNGIEDWKNRRIELTLNINEG